MKDSKLIKHLYQKRRVISKICKQFNLGLSEIYSGRLDYHLVSRLGTEEHHIQALNF